jgi:hypothetical protein
MELLTERYAAQIAGVLSCGDRVLIFGTLPEICFAGGMTSFLDERKVRSFDYPRFATRRSDEKKQPFAIGQPVRFVSGPGFANFRVGQRRTSSS